MRFRNVTDQRRGEEFLLSDRAEPVSRRREIAGEWWVRLITKKWKVYMNGVDLLLFLIYAMSRFSIQG
jgi:hypothetical protein